MEKRTNYCGTFMLIVAWLSVIGGAFLACYIIKLPSLGIAGFITLLSSPFLFGFVKIVKAAHIYILNNSENESAVEEKSKEQEPTLYQMIAADRDAANKAEEVNSTNTTNADNG